MGQENGNDKRTWQIGSAIITNWIQFALLVLTLVTFALHTESRLSKIEQRLDDGEKQIGRMQGQLDRIESFMYARTP
jgi:hypothetical protein